MLWSIGDLLTKKINSEVMKLKIILSRKGFDLSDGGIPSPIFDDELLSLPIPEEIDFRTNNSNRPKYTDLSYRGKSYKEIIENLGSARCYQKITNGYNEYCHLDPDLSNRLSHADWKPAFGQCGSAEGHLRNHNIDKGDLFLFYGWFRQAQFNTLKFDSKAQDLHVIFGYMQIGERWILDDDKNSQQRAKIEYPLHPHTYKKQNGKNSLYIPTDKLTLENFSKTGAKPGYGLLKYSRERQLTMPNSNSRCHWDFGGFLQAFNVVDITYHNNQTYGMINGIFCAAQRGQEFIFEYDPSNVEMADWLSKVLYD